MRDRLETFRTVRNRERFYLNLAARFEKENGVPLSRWALTRHGRDSFTCAALWILAFEAGAGGAGPSLVQGAKCPTGQAGRQ